MLALSEALRQEVNAYSIRTTVISPGAVATELPDSVTDPDAAAWVRKFYEESAIPAVARPSPAHTFLNLCSDRRFSGRGWSLNVCGQFVHDTSPT